MRDIDNIIEDLEKLHKELIEWRDSLKQTQDWNQNPVVPLQPYSPTNPQWPYPPSTPYDPNPTMGHCPKCNLELKQVMGYYCSQPDCPTGLGGPSCVSNSADGRSIC